LSAHSTVVFSYYQTQSHVFLSFLLCSSAFRIGSALGPANLIGDQRDREENRKDCKRKPYLLALLKPARPPVDVPVDAELGGTCRSADPVLIAFAYGAPQVLKLVQG